MSGFERRKEGEITRADWFSWNPYADQPHNVAPKWARRRRHVRNARDYVALAAKNLALAVPVLRRTRNLLKTVHERPADIGAALGCAVSEAGDRSAEVIDLLRETGVRLTLVRLASWERDRMPRIEAFVNNLRAAGFEVCLALLQRRRDVFDPGGWRAFLDEALDRFAPLCPYVEIGHAWNRTKWGVWSHDEYIALADPAFDLAARHGTRLVGPAVIDFEFHLYPAVLRRLPFDTISSLLYVDRVGAPENRQFGWDATAKAGLLRAVVDSCRAADRSLWVTEVNWPLAGTEPYSPAVGKPNVGEEEQADYLVRYNVPLLTSGFIERIYWWQLVAPGYGLVDSREEPWRLRPSFRALRALVKRIEGARFLGKMTMAAKDRGTGPPVLCGTETAGDQAAVSRARRPEEAPGRTPEKKAGSPDRAKRRLPADFRVFLFRKNGETCAVCWTTGRPEAVRFDRPVAGIEDRDGNEIGAGDEAVILDGSPKYVVFEK